MCTLVQLCCTGFMCILSNQTKPWTVQIFIRLITLAKTRYNA